jgi:hypothetical protein
VVLASIKVLSKLKESFSPKTISTKSPAYQRWVQKANAMAYDNPTRFRQIMSLVDDKFASEAMRKRVSNLRSAIAKEGRERTFGLASKRLSSGLALRKRETDIALKNMKTAKTLKEMWLKLIDGKKWKKNFMVARI